MTVSFAYYSWRNVKEYRAKVVLHNKDGGPVDRLIRVNYPAYHRGVYLYLSSPCCRVVFRLQGGQTVHATQSEEFEIPGAKGRFTVDYIVSGDLYKLNGEKETIKPFLKVHYTSPTGERKDYKKVFLNESIDLDGVAVTPERIIDGIVVAYRHDPAMPMLWMGMILVTGGMCLRIYGYSYRMRFAYVQTEDGNRKLSVSVRGRGILASEERMKRKCRRRGKTR